MTNLSNEADVPKDLEDREAVETKFDADQADNTSHHSVSPSSNEFEATAAGRNDARNEVHVASDEHTVSVFLCC